MLQIDIDYVRHIKHEIVAIVSHFTIKKHIQRQFLGQNMADNKNCEKLSLNRFFSHTDGGSIESYLSGYLETDH